MAAGHQAASGARDDAERQERRATVQAEEEAEAFKTMTFHVGQEVVCVHAEETNTIDVQELESGRIYRVRWVGTYTYEDWPSLEPYTEPAIRLEGVDRSRTLFGRMRLLCGLDGDPPFQAGRFRPLEKVKHSAEVEKLKRFCEPAHMHEKV
jgi:hypothetical protein